MSLLVAGGLEPDDLEGPFQSKPFYDSVIPVILSQSLSSQAVIQIFLGLFLYNELCQEDNALKKLDFYYGLSQED